MPLLEVSSSNSRALQDIADSITKSHKILVVTGAGISTSCGIPDFRSKDGLYNLIPEQSILPTPSPSEPSTPCRKRKASELDDDDIFLSQSSHKSSRSSNSPASRMKGQDLFHSRVFQNSETTEVFYQFIASLRQKIRDEVEDTSATHKFIRTLRDGGRLMRCYTQNIDGLEAREGLCVDLARGKGNKRRFMKKHYESPRPDRIQDTDFDGGCEVVQLHGELTRLRCTMCSTEAEWTDDATRVLLQGFAPKCEECDTKSQIRLATGKRGLTVGGLRPNIVLYGEEHPQNTMLSPLVPYDVSSNPDLLLIMGTSLKVHGLQKIIRDFAKAVHNQKNGRVVFINRTRPAESVWDGIIDDFVAMDCDDWIHDLRLKREDLWKRQGELNLKESKPSAIKRKRKSDGLDLEGEQVSKKLKVKQNANLSIDVPKSNEKGRDVLSASTPKKRATSWKNPPKSGSLRDKVLSPLARANRPVVSPLRRSFKPLQVQSDADVEPSRAFDVSPIAPLFSPLTPRSSARSNTSRTPSKLQICEDVNQIKEENLSSDDSTTLMESQEDDTGEDEEVRQQMCAQESEGVGRNDEDLPPTMSTGFVGRLLVSSITGRFTR